MAAELQTVVLIVGGGPAGATAAALLAEQAVPVVILEQHAGPSAQEGVSLLPHTLPLLDRLGVHETVRGLRSTQVKEGTSFATGHAECRVDYWFHESAVPTPSHAYNVRRDEFDEVLLRRATALGAEVLPGWRATAPIWDGGRLIGLAARDARGAKRRITARVVLDASGRECFLASRTGWRFPFPRHRKMAAFANFQGVEELPGRRAGVTAVVVCRAGWFWLIPLADGSTSVGVVRDAGSSAPPGNSPQQVLEHAVAETPEVRRRLAAAQRCTPVATVHDFSYRVMRVAGDGYGLLGDAAGFLDPIFSSGVHVAMTTAAAAAEDVAEALIRHGRVDGSDLGPTIAVTRALQRTFSSLIRSFYDPSFLAVFLHPRPFLGVPRHINSILAGHVLGSGRWRRTAGLYLWRVVAALQKRRAWPGDPPIPWSQGSSRTPGDAAQ